MTNEEAFKKLRGIARNGSYRTSQACNAGADAIELLDWLFTLDGNGQMRAPELLQHWNGEGEFVEWVREEMRRELHAL